MPRASITFGGGLFGDEPTRRPTNLAPATLTPAVAPAPQPKPTPKPTPALTPPPEPAPPAKVVKLRFGVTPPVEPPAPAAPTIEELGIEAHRAAEGVKWAKRTLAHYEEERDVVLNSRTNCTASAEAVQQAVRRVDVAIRGLESAEAKLAKAEAKLDAAVKAEQDRQLREHLARQGRLTSY